MGLGQSSESSKHRQFFASVSLGDVRAVQEACNAIIPATVILSLYHVLIPLTWCHLSLIVTTGVAKVNQPYEDGDFPLEMAAVQGNTEMVTLLLQMRANVDQQDRAGVQPHYYHHYCIHTSGVIDICVHGYRWSDRITLCRTSATCLCSVNIVNSTL